MADDLRERVVALETTVSTMANSIDRLTKALEKHAEAMQRKAVEDAELRGKRIAIGVAVVFVLSMLGDFVIKFAEKWI